MDAMECVVRNVAAIERRYHEERMPRDSA
jgi:hypothetical protein